MLTTTGNAQPRSGVSRRPRRAKSFDHRDFRVRTRVIHGYRRAFRLAGSGPAILLIHGIGDSSVTWETVLPELALDYTVLAPDLLGHGESDKPRGDYSVAGFANAMRDLLTVLDIDRVTVMGHSLGGGVAAQFGYEYPERVERLVMVATGGVSRNVSPLLRLAAAPGVDLAMPVLSAPPMRLAGRAVGEVLRYFGAGLGLDVEEIMRVFGALPDAQSRRSIVRTLRSGVDWHGQVITMLDRAYLAQSVPSQIIWGAKDAIIPVSHGYLLHEALPGSRLEVFEEAAHFPHHTDPARFVRVVDEFMRATPPAEFSAERWRTLLRAGRPDIEFADAG